jgi:hypothetical protein
MLETRVGVTIITVFIQLFDLECLHAIHRYFFAANISFIVKYLSIYYLSSAYCAIMVTCVYIEWLITDHYFVHVVMFLYIVLTGSWVFYWKLLSALMMYSCSHYTFFLHFFVLLCLIVYNSRWLLPFTTLSIPWCS